MNDISKAKRERKLFQLRCDITRLNKEITEIRYENENLRKEIDKKDNHINNLFNRRVDEVFKYAKSTSVYDQPEKISIFKSIVEFMRRKK